MEEFNVMISKVMSNFLVIMISFMAFLLLLEFVIVKLKKILYSKFENKFHRKKENKVIPLYSSFSGTSAVSSPSSFSSFPGEYVFDRRSVMTKTEKDFFLILLKAVPELYIFPQVSFLALLDPIDKPSLGKIQSKRVDFVVYDIKTDAYCVIELDDRSHNNKQSKDLERDLFFDSASIRSLRYKTNNKPSPEALREDILNALF